MRPLEFGWYLPTHGDTTAYGLMDAQIPGSLELCDRVVQAAEKAGFEYLLIPVGSTCWEAWISGAFMAARSSTIKPLIAARPGYINPVLLAKMISTFDQMSGGRICVNLIAGQNESEVEGEGVRYPKEERYALMEEEVSIVKALWTTRGPLNFEGKFHKLSGAHIRPRPLQQPLQHAVTRKDVSHGRKVAHRLRVPRHDHSPGWRRHDGVAARHGCEVPGGVVLPRALVTVLPPTVGRLRQTQDRT